MHRCHAQTLAGSTSVVDTCTTIGSSSDLTLFHEWQPDNSAICHVTPHKEWFSMFFAVRQDAVHSVRDIRLQFFSGSVLVLHDVQYTCSMCQMLNRV